MAISRRPAPKSKVAPKLAPKPVISKRPAPKPVTTMPVRPKAPVKGGGMVAKPAVMPKNYKSPPAPMPISANKPAPKPVVAKQPIKKAPIKGSPIPETSTVKGGPMKYPAKKASYTY
jgi:hypothetical protein